MACLSIYALRTFYATLDGELIAAFESNKVWASLVEPDATRDAEACASGWALEDAIGTALDEISVLDRVGQTG